MKQFLFIGMILSFLATGAVAQEVKTSEKKADPVSKMNLRANTRDRVMISKGNTRQLRIQQRKAQAITKSQQIRQRHMLLHQQQRNMRQQQQQHIRRKAVQRQMMQQQQKQPRPGGRH